MDFDNGTILQYYKNHKLSNKHNKTLQAIFKTPTVNKIRWQDIEMLFRALGAEISEREGSRVGIKLFGDRKLFHRPHPSPYTDKGAVVSIRKWLLKHGVTHEHNGN